MALSLDDKEWIGEQLKKLRLEMEEQTRREIERRIARRTADEDEPTLRDSMRVGVGRP
jgi:hypothetical protein